MNRTPPEETALESAIQIEQSGNRSMRSEDIAKAVQEVMSSANPELKSDLSAHQIVLVTIAKAYAELYHCTLLDSVIDDLLRLRFSFKRKSRNEMVDSIKSAMVSTDIQPDRMPRKLLGI